MTKEVFKVLFERHYNRLYQNAECIKKAREARFKRDFYWQIWKSHTPFFGIIEGVFHRSNGFNVLTQIPTTEQEIFTAPQLLLDRFKTPQDLSTFFEEIYRQNLIKNGKTSPQTAAIMRFRNQNADFIIKLSKEILTQYDGSPLNMLEKCPEQTRQNFINLAGYNRKIANMVLNCVFDCPEIAIDVRVFRACEQLGLIPPQKFKITNNKHKAEIEEIVKHYASEFTIEADFLLFQEGALH
jgi:endonuclease III